MYLSETWPRAVIHTTHIIRSTNVVSYFLTSVSAKLSIFGIQQVKSPEEKEKKKESPAKKNKKVVKDADVEAARTNEEPADETIKVISAVGPEVDEDAARALQAQVEEFQRVLKEVCLGHYVLFFKSFYLVSFGFETQSIVDPYLCIPGNSYIKLINNVILITL